MNWLADAGLQLKAGYHQPSPMQPTYTMYLIALLTLILLLRFKSEVLHALYLHAQIHLLTLQQLYKHYTNHYVVQPAHIDRTTNGAQKQLIHHSQTANTFERLPADSVLHVFSYLTAVDITRLQQTSSGMYHAAADPQLWKNLCSATLESNEAGKLVTLPHLRIASPRNTATPSSDAAAQHSLRTEAQQLLAVQLESLREYHQHLMTSNSLVSHLTASFTSSQVDKLEFANSIDSQQSQQQCIAMQPVEKQYYIEQILPHTQHVSQSVQQLHRLQLKLSRHLRTIDRNQCMLLWSLWMLTWLLHGELSMLALFHSFVLPPTLQLVWRTLAEGNAVKALVLLYTCCSKILYRSLSLYTLTCNEVAPHLCFGTYSSITKMLTLPAAAHNLRTGTQWKVASAEQQRFDWTVKLNKMTLNDISHVLATMLGSFIPTLIALTLCWSSMDEVYAASYQMTTQIVHMSVELTIGLGVPLVAVFQLLSCLLQQPLILLLGSSHSNLHLTVARLFSSGQSSIPLMYEHDARRIGRLQQWLRRYHVQLLLWSLCAMLGAAEHMQLCESHSYVSTAVKALTAVIAL